MADAPATSQAPQRSSPASLPHHAALAAAGLQCSDARPSQVSGATGSGSGMQESLGISAYQSSSITAMLSFGPYLVLRTL